MSDAVAERRLPTGTVTFLFSDIEGSTQRWETHRDAMRGALDAHDAVVKAIVARSDGQVFKTLGDGFCAVFGRAPDAMGAALDVQRAIREGDFDAVGGLKVRIALHSGHSEERSGDYFGPAVNRVARLLSIGHGGQVLVSGVTTELTQDEMPPQSSLRDLGLQRLRDLTYPEQVYQLCAPDLPLEFPPLRSLDELPNNLPLQVTSFVGRESEATTLKERLSKARLVTLVGAGGIGKTRLSLQAGADALDEYPDGVWFVELAPVRDARSVPDVVASVFNVNAGEGRTPTDAVVSFLKRKKALLIFDNCEHLVEDAARMIDAIIRNCPQVQVIASSRQGLDIAGEAVHRVSSLTIPEPDAHLGAEQALSYGSIALFVDRAQAANSQFDLVDGNLEHVTRICRRLDGIALAIELAASRVKVMSVASLADRLDDRFRILTGGSRTALPRQQTMRALIDWSYDLLSEQERSLFERLAIFAGGWTLATATTVCADESVQDWEVLDTLSKLVDKSLVVVDLSGRDERYRLLESTRQYALEKLEGSGEFDRYAFAHARFFADLAVAADVASARKPLQALLVDIVPEVDNIRAAIAWALAQRHDVTLGCTIVGALGYFWRDLSAGEGERWIRKALDVAKEATNATVPLVVQARLFCAFGQTDITSDPRVLEAAQAARSLYDELGMRREGALATRLMGFYYFRGERYDEAIVYLNEALGVFRDCSDERWAGRTLADLATAMWCTGKVGEAKTLYAQSLSAARALGDGRELARAALNLAESQFATGETEQAIATAVEIFERPEKFDRSLRANTAGNLAAYFVIQSNIEEARTYGRLALQISREMLSSQYTNYAVQHLAGVAAISGDVRKGARLLGYSDARYDALSAKRESTERKSYEKALEVLLSLTSAQELRVLMADGATMTEEQAVEEAFTI